MLKWYRNFQVFHPEFTGFDYDERDEKVFLRFTDARYMYEMSLDDVQEYIAELLIKHKTKVENEDMLRAFCREHFNKIIEFMKNHGEKKLTWRYYLLKHDGRITELLDADLFDYADEHGRIVDMTGFMEQCRAWDCELLIKKVC
jgi:hypothetical protein